MCTAVSYKTDDHYFGRNLDLDRSYGEAVTVTPRYFPLRFKYEETISEHYAMIGMAAVADGVPLYFDATNEAGLSAAGLNFPHFCEYGEARCGEVNLASFEVISFALARCAAVEEVRGLLSHARITSDAFDDDLPPTPLHFMFSDREESIVLEVVRGRVKIYDDPACVLTNAPDFPYHMQNLVNYVGVSRVTPESNFGNGLKLEPYSFGMGAIGLPGDFSSASRFVRAAYVRSNSVCELGEADSVSQFFHILSSVAVPEGCVLSDGGKYHYTRYSSCCNTERGIYYYTTYGNSCVTAVDMRRCELDEYKLSVFPLQTETRIERQN